VVAVDVDERVSFLNGAARTILGLAAGERVEGRRLYELLRDPKILGLLQAASDEGRPVDAEISHEGPPRRMVQVHAAPVGGDRPGVILVLRDMSRLRQLERMRSDFVSNVSHELRTPLASISAAAENLQDVATRRDDEAASRFVGAIRRNAARLETLLDDILALSRFESRPETIERASMDFAALVRAACDELRERAEAAGVVLRVGTPAGLALVGDVQALRRIVDNLVVNAITYTPRGGRVEVALALGGGDAVLTVADTGIGIPKADLDSIFERFYRVDKARSRSAGGTGLGLSIVKHAVGLHGGTVSVESQVGSGSKFTVRIPEARLEPRSEAAQTHGQGAETA
ncbi:MAG: ATP-binding protein, partial [Planctomycetota bacterium]